MRPIDADLLNKHLEEIKTKNNSPINVAIIDGVQKVVNAMPTLKDSEKGCEVDG